jgi:hypothetical protein
VHKAAILDYIIQTSIYREVSNYVHTTSAATNCNTTVLTNLRLGRLRRLLHIYLELRAQYQSTNNILKIIVIFGILYIFLDRLCGLVVRVLGYRFGGPGSIPGTNRKKKFSVSGTGCTQPREYKLRSYLIEK